MTDIVLRSVKGSTLTNNELDSNFSNLNNEKSYTFTQESTPANPQEGDSWYKPSTGEVKYYDTSSWQALSVNDGYF